MESDLTIRKIERADADRLLHEFRRQGWAKPREVLEGYYEEQRRGERTVLIADCQGETAGYITLRPTASAGPFAGRGIPELTDLIVFIRFQRRGIGSRLLEAAEKAAASSGSAVTLGVGLHSGYGPAQRLYVKRGYIPDGSGVWFRDQPLDPYADCRNDDELILYMSKKLKREGGADDEA